jgi:hypothetical protein
MGVNYVQTYFAQRDRSTDLGWRFDRRTVSCLLYADGSSSSHDAPPTCENVDQDIATSVTWDQPCYRVITNTVSVLAAAHLTVLPGTTVYFDAGSRLRVAQDGGLTAGAPQRAYHLHLFGAFAHRDAVRLGRHPNRISGRARCSH